MNTLRRLRNLWIPCVATIVLGCFSDAVAQTELQNYRFGYYYSKDFFSMAMGVNNHGWAENSMGSLTLPRIIWHDSFQGPRGDKRLRIQHRPGHAWRTRR